ncbi:MAG: hypothetical protein JXR88_13090 [Clostridia bacterium]|nr:hypothetical protein [Clostridia bacterium]
MGRQVYQEGEFKVYRAGNNYIVHNTRFIFNQAHTHVRTLNTAKRIIYCTCHKVIPKTFPEYLLQSLIRVSDDALYCDRIEALIEVRKQKGKKLKYVN